MVITHDTEPVWDKPVDVPEKWIQSIDDNVLASEQTSASLRCSFWQYKKLTESELPYGSHVKSIFPHGASYWTRTAEIKTEQADGTPLSFFLKVNVTHSTSMNVGDNVMKSGR